MAKGTKKGKGKLSKAEKERLKKEEADRKLQEEEEARLRAEQEAREREEKERQEKEERRLFEEQERARHQAEVDELNLKIAQNKSQLSDLRKERWKQSNWDRYMECNGGPDPLSIKELNTFMNLWREDVSEKKIEEVLQECEVTLEIMKQIENNLQVDAISKEDKKDMREDLDVRKELVQDWLLGRRTIKPMGVQRQRKQLIKGGQALYTLDMVKTIQKLQDLIFFKLDLATFKLLKSPLEYIDQDTFNIMHTAKSKNITICTWGNTAKNPRVKVVEFAEEGFMMDIPKNLAMADVAIRVMHIECDFLSPKSSSFHIQTPKQTKKEIDHALDEEKKAESRVEHEEIPEAEKPASTSLSGERVRTSSRKFSAKSMENSIKEEEIKQSESKVSEVEAEERGNTAAETDTLVDVLDVGEDEEADFLDEDVVDLRSFSPLGPLIYIELLELPPQPKQSKGWILQQTVDAKLKRIPYTIPNTPLARSTSRGSNNQGQDSALDESRGSAAPGSNLTTPLGQTTAPIGMRISLPKRAVVFEEPQFVRWDDTNLQWRLDGFIDQKYSQEDSHLSFKTTYFGPYAIMQDLYLNMPFQSWELRPTGLNQCVLFISAASVDVEIEIEDERCRLLKPKDRPQVQHLLGQWMTPGLIIQELRSVGLNVFAAEDGHKYVSICQKDANLVNSVYEQMALSASAYAYSWSRWNNENKKEDAIVLQATEWLKRLPVNDDKYALYMASTRICCRLKMTEYDSEFDETIADNTQMHPDLFHMLQDGGSNEAKSLVQNTSYLFSDCVLSLLQAANVLIYS